MPPGELAKWRAEQERRDEVLQNSNPGNTVTVNLHNDRNYFNRCPVDKPSRPNANCPYTDRLGNEWTSDTEKGYGRYHPGNDCYRSGRNQCCYDLTTGVLDDHSPSMGTYDWVPPDSYWPLGYLGHWYFDVLPHWVRGDYTPGLTQTY